MLGFIFIIIRYLKTQGTTRTSSNSSISSLLNELLHKLLRWTFNINRGTQWADLQVCMLSSILANWKLHSWAAIDGKWSTNIEVDRIVRVSLEPFTVQTPSANHNQALKLNIEHSTTESNSFLFRTLSLKSYMSLTQRIIT